MHPGPFGCLTKLGAKRAELVQKFVPQNRIIIFHNERTQSTPLDPKQTFWCVLYLLGAFRTIWLSYKTRCKTGRTSAKVLQRSRVGIFRNERTRSTPLDHKLRFWCASWCFGCILDGFINAENQVQTGLNWCNYCKILYREVAMEFFAMNTPSPTHWTLNSCFCAFRSVWVHL